MNTTKIFLIKEWKKTDYIFHTVSFEYRRRICNYLSRWKRNMWKAVGVDVSTQENFTTNRVTGYRRTNDIYLEPFPNPNLIVHHYLRIISRRIENENDSDNVGYIYHFVLENFFIICPSSFWLHTNSYTTKNNRSKITSAETKYTKEIWFWNTNIIGLFNFFMQSIILQVLEPILFDVIWKMLIISNNKKTIMSIK